MCDVCGDLCKSFVAAIPDRYWDSEFFAACFSDSSAIWRRFPLGMPEKSRKDRPRNRPIAGRDEAAEKPVYFSAYVAVQVM